jgi:hypothetical protein
MVDKSGEDGSGKPQGDELLPETWSLLQHYCTRHRQLVRRSAALFFAESRVDISVDVMSNIRVNPAQQNNRTARTEGAQEHPISLIGVDNGEDGRGPEIMRSHFAILFLRMGLTPPHAVYVHPAGMSRVNRVEAVNAALSARLLNDVPFPPLEEEA